MRGGGSLSYKGTLLCTEPEGLHLPTPGDHLLLIGVHGLWESNPEELSVEWFFVVENGEVIPDVKVHPYMAESEAKPLSTLRAELMAKGKEQLP